MKTIELNILAEDIRTADYFDQRDCPITRALKRANINAYDQGMDILSPKGRIKTPKDLVEKVLLMYKSFNPYIVRIGEPLEPQDFTFSLEVPDNW